MRLWHLQKCSSLLDNPEVIRFSEDVVFCVICDHYKMLLRFADLHDSAPGRLELPSGEE